MAPKLPQSGAYSLTNTILSAGTPIASPKAVHTGGSNGPITYSILSGNEKGTFSIQPNTGKGLREGTSSWRSSPLGPRRLWSGRGFP